MASIESDVYDHFRSKGLREITMNLDLSVLERAILGRFQWRKRVGMMLIRLGCIIMRMEFKAEVRS